ncbi:hypothetical protein L1049_024300 [Liquidambar formosana]|uniref:Cytochrome P450 n=1 Tax=Liquidambar formosana TaxID=63359 RepID=A0AAP0X4R1_LIQFO
MAVLLLCGAVLCVLMVSWCLKVLHMIWWKPKMIEKQLRKQGIYGHPYKLFYGNTKEMMKLSKENGSKPLGLSHDFLPRFNPFLQKLVMTYNKIFVIWYGTTPQVIILDPKLIREILTNKSGDFRKTEINSFTELFVTGLVSYDGDRWAKHRKIVNPAFHTEKLKRMLPAFSICCDEMIEKWDKLLGSAGSCELDVLLEFQNLTGDVISRAAFGSSFEEGRLIFLLQNEQGQLLIRSQYNIRFPWLSISLQKTTPFQYSILVLMMAALFYNGPIHIIRVLFSFLGSFVNLILLEVLRLYPPTSLVRCTHKETKLGGLSLPAGVHLLIPLHIVHRDHEQWGEDAMEFNPDRFSEGVLKASKDQISYFPFGWGPRICIGQNFAMLEAKLAITLILQHFWFELSPSYTHAPSISITLQPQYGAQIILHKA